MDIYAWDHRFRQQAAWTDSLRRYYFTRLNLSAGSRVLEAGCGTGAITAQLEGLTPARRCGLDINPAYLRLARENDPRARFTCGDALRLPYPSSTFDAVYCHYFLLWVRDPAAAVAEMARVTRPGGMVLAFAEPDYGGRIDYPPALAELGAMQSAALRRQGADPEMGRKLSALFHAAGLHQVETGVLGGQWQSAPSAEALESEWSTLAADLAGSLPPDRLEALRQTEQAAWQSGARTLFVPTFYAVGKK